MICRQLKHLLRSGEFKSKTDDFVRDPKWINGLDDYRVTVKRNIQVSDSEIFEEVSSGTVHVFQLNFKNFKPGSVAVVKYTSIDLI